LSKSTRLTDRQTDTILIVKPRLHSMQRGITECGCQPGACKGPPWHSYIDRRSYRGLSQPLYIITLDTIHQYLTAMLRNSSAAHRCKRRT